jgi:hypothetical protein
MIRPAALSRERTARHEQRAWRDNVRNFIKFRAPVITDCLPKRTGRGLFAVIVNPLASNRGSSVLRERAA